MARTIDQIKQTISDAVTTDDNLKTELTSTSSVSLWGLFAYAVAYCVFTLETLFDNHKADVDAIISILKPHTPRWYQAKSLSFQYGYALVSESDYYDNTGISEDDIATSKIIKYAAINEATAESRLIIKVATEASGVLQPLTTPQIDSFTAYIARIKDAGVYTTIINYLPDQLYLYIRIYFDPLILDSTGANILDGGKPIEDALNEFVRTLPFNGEFVVESLVDKLQQVPGVVIPHVDNAQSSFIDPDTSMYGTPVNIDVKKTPESGYFQIVNFDNITYLPNV